MLLCRKLSVFAVEYGYRSSLKAVVGVIFTPTALIAVNEFHSFINALAVVCVIVTAEDRFSTPFFEDRVEHTRVFFRHAAFFVMAS